MSETEVIGKKQAYQPDGIKDQDGSKDSSVLCPGK